MVDGRHGCGVVTQGTFDGHRVISCVRLWCPSTSPLVYLADGTCSGLVRLLHSHLPRSPAVSAPARPPRDPRFGPEPAACTTRLDRSSLPRRRPRCHFAFRAFFASPRGLRPFYWPCSPPPRSCARSRRGQTSPVEASSPRS